MGNYGKRDIQKPNTFTPISCHACAIGNAVMSLCIECRRYYCATHWDEHYCTKNRSGDEKIDE